VVRGLFWDAFLPVEDFLLEEEWLAEEDMIVVVVLSVKAKRVL
jgi:hypothetical protein